MTSLGISTLSYYDGTNGFMVQTQGDQRFELYQTGIVAWCKWYNGPGALISSGYVNFGYL